MNMISRKIFSFTSTYLNCLNFQTSNKDRSSFWGHQRSLDGGTNYHPNLPDPFDLEEEEVTLEGNSQILSEEDVNFLSQQLPARLVGSVWHLLFSTGKCISLSFFLSSLWFKMEEYHASSKDILGNTIWSLRKLEDQYGPSKPDTWCLHYY